MQSLRFFPSLSVNLVVDAILALRVYSFPRRAARCNCSLETVICSFPPSSQGCKRRELTVHVASGPCQFCCRRGLPSETCTDSERPKVPHRFRLIVSYGTFHFSQRLSARTRLDLTARSEGLSTGSRCQPVCLDVGTGPPIKAWRSSGLVPACWQHA